MNLEQFYEELKKLETTALCVQTEESSKKYCQRIFEKLESFAVEGVGYKEHGQAVLQCIKSLLKTRKYLSAPPEVISALCHNIVLRVANVALNWEWLRLADQDELKMAFRQNVMAASTQLPSDEEKQEFQNAVKLLSNDHWREPTLDKILNGDESLTEMEAVNYIRRQEPYVILARLKMLAGSEETAAIAINLSRWCILDDRFREDVYVRKMLLTKLYLLNRELFHQETVRVPCCLASKVLTSLMEEKPRDLDLCIHCAGTFVVQDWLKPHSYCCTKGLLEKWVMLHIEKRVQQNEDDLQENLVKLVNLTQNTLQLTYLIDVLKTQVGEGMLGYCSMLCLRALNMDMDIMNKAKEAQAQERWKNSRSNVAHVCHFIYDLFKPYSKEIAREGILAWFSLDPTPSNYRAVEDYFLNGSVFLLKDSNVDLEVIHIESLKVRVVGLIISELITCINADWSEVQPVMVSHLESLGFVYDQSSNTFSQTHSHTPEIGLPTEGSLPPNTMEISEEVPSSVNLKKPNSVPCGLPMHPPSPPDISEGAINAATAAFFPVKSLGEIIANNAPQPSKETQQLSEGTLLNAVLLGTTQSLQHGFSDNVVVALPDPPLLMATDTSPTVEKEGGLENQETEPEDLRKGVSLENSKNTPPVTTGENRQASLEENPSSVPEENPSAVLEDSTHHIIEKSPNAVAENNPQEMKQENSKDDLEENPEQENPNVAPEENSQIITPASSTVITQKEPQVVSENPQIVSQENPQVNIMEKPQLDSEKPHIIRQENPHINTQEEPAQEVPEIVLENPQIIPPENPEVNTKEEVQIVSENPEIITQENPQVNTQEETEVVSESTQIITQENPQESALEEPRIVSENPEIITQENPQVTAQEEPQEIPRQNPQVNQDNPQSVPEESSKPTSIKISVASKENMCAITQDISTVVPKEDSQSTQETSDIPEVTKNTLSISHDKDSDLKSPSEAEISARKQSKEEVSEHAQGEGELVTTQEEMEIEESKLIPPAEKGVTRKEEAETERNESPMSVEPEEPIVEHAEVNEPEQIKESGSVESSRGFQNDAADEGDKTKSGIIGDNKQIPTVTNQKEESDINQQSTAEEEQSVDEEDEIVNVESFDDEKETDLLQKEKEDTKDNAENLTVVNVTGNDTTQIHVSEANIKGDHLSEDDEQNSADGRKDNVTNIDSCKKEDNQVGEPDETPDQQIKETDKVEAVNSEQVEKDVHHEKEAPEAYVQNLSHNPESEPQLKKIPGQITECQDEEPITFEPPTGNSSVELMMEDKSKPTEIPVELSEVTKEQETAVVHVPKVDKEPKSSEIAQEVEEVKGPVGITADDVPPSLIDEQIITYEVKNDDPSSPQVIIFQEALETNELGDSAQNVSIDAEENSVAGRGYITIEFDEDESGIDKDDDSEDSEEKQYAPIVVGREEEPPPPLLEEECGSAGESGSDEMPILSPSVEKLDKDEIDETERSLAEADAILYKAQRVLNQKLKPRKKKTALKDQPKSYRKIIAKEKEDVVSESIVNEKVKKVPPKPVETQNDQLIKWENEKDVKSVNLEGGQKMLVVPANHPILKKADLGGVFVPGSVQTVATDLKNAVKFQSGPKFFKSKYYSVGGTGRSMDSDTYKCETCGKYILKSNKKKHDEQKCSKNVTTAKLQSEPKKLAYPVKNTEHKSFSKSEEKDDVHSNNSAEEAPGIHAPAGTENETDTNTEGFVVINTPVESNSNTPSVENQNQLTPINNSEEYAIQQQPSMGEGYITADGQEFYSADLQHQYIVTEQCEPQAQQEQQPESGSFSFLQTSIDLVNFNENVDFDNRPLVAVQKPAQESPEKKPTSKSEDAKENEETEIESETKDNLTDLTTKKNAKSKGNRCVICSKRFITRPDLVEHLKTHQSKFMKFRNPPGPPEDVADDDDIEEPATAEVSESEIEETKSESKKQYITLEVQKKVSRVAKTISVEDYKNNVTLSGEEEDDEPFKSKLEPETNESIKELQERKVTEDKIREKYFNDLYTKQVVELGATIIKRSRSYLQCSECPATFPSKKCLTKHVQCAHKNMNTGDIKIPKFTAEMIDEILDKVPVTQLVCPICSLGYSTHEGMKKHVLSHKPKPTYYPGRCPVCLSAFPSLIGLKAHMRSHPNFKFCATEKDILPLTALEPSMTGEKAPAKTKEAIIRDSVKTLTPASQTCPACNLMFKNRRGVRIHLRHQHPEVYRKFDLEGCPDLEMSPLQIAASSVQQATSYSTFRKNIMEQKQKKKIKTVVLGNQKLNVTDPETFIQEDLTVAEELTMPTKVTSAENTGKTSVKQTAVEKDPSDKVQSTFKTSERKRAAPIDIASANSNGSVVKPQSQNTASDEPVVKKKRGPIFREQEWDPEKLMKKIEPPMEKPKVAIAKRGPRVTRKRSHSPTEADELSEQSDQTITIRIISPAKNRANKRRHAKQRKSAVQAEPDLVMDTDETVSEAGERSPVDPAVKADAAGRSTIIALMEETTQEKKYLKSELYLTSSSGNAKTGPKTEQEVKDVVMQNETCDDPNKFRCNICGAVMFKKLWTLHHFMHVPKSRVTAIKTKAGLYFRCIQCKEVFTHKAPVFYHFYKEHKDLMIKSEHNPLAIECHFCGVTCRNLEALHEHLMNHILTTDIEFLQSGELKCLCCKKKLQKEEYFVWHFLSKHADRLVSEME